MKRLMRDERGSSPYIMITGLIAAPLIMAVIAGASISAMRTGTGLTEAFTRGALAQTLLEDFRTNLGSASTIDIDSATRIAVSVDPAALPAALPVAVDSIGENCVTTTWELTPSGDLVTLTKTRAVHDGACDQPVAKSAATELTGLASGAAFTFANASGRPLELVDGAFVPAAGNAPAGVSAGAWADTVPSVLHLDATMQEMFGERAMVGTAVAP